MANSHSPIDSRLTLRQLANLGLPSAVLLPPALGAVREIVHAEHMGFFFCDDQGQITNLYAERMLSPAQMAQYHQNHFSHQESNFKLAYQKRVAAKSPVSVYSLSPQEKQSAYYSQVLQPLDISHFLYAIVRMDGKPIGQLSAYRGAAGIAFSKADQRHLAEVLHYIERLFNPQVQSIQGETSAPIAETGMAILDDDGKIIYADKHWDRLLRMARGGSINPQFAQDEVQLLPRFLASILALFRASKILQHTVKTEWGTFRFRSIALSGQAGTAQSLSINRLADERVFLAESVALLKLPVQQREVAVLVSQGKSNAQIAAKMGISVNTVGYHVKALFTKLDIHDRGDLLAAITRAVEQ
jgi:DNA-binding CsgD family transcriptional regulator